MFKKRRIKSTSNHHRYCLKIRLVWQVHIFLHFCELIKIEETPVIISFKLSVMLFWINCCWKILGAKNVRTPRKKYYISSPFGLQSTIYIVHRSVSFGSNFPGLPAAAALTMKFAIRTRDQTLAGRCVHWISWGGGVRVRF